MVFWLAGVTLILAGAFFTLTVALTDLPDIKVAVILALPAFFAVILPELFTVATDGLLLE